MLIPFAIVLFIVLFECTTTDGRIVPPTENLRIAIVQVLTGPYVHKFGRFSAAVSCYAARHHYHHHVQNVPIERAGVTNAHAFDTKIGVVKKYLPHYDWIFLLDSDAFPANFNCRLESYLEGSGDEVMLVVGMREWSIEVMSGGLFLRNVPNGHLFLEQWQQNFGTVPNTDNGALSKTIANWLREHDHLVPRHCRPRFENECRFWWGCYKNIRMYPPLHFAMRTGFNLRVKNTRQFILQSCWVMSVLCTQKVSICWTKFHHFAWLPTFVRLALTSSRVTGLQHGSRQNC